MDNLHQVFYVALEAIGELDNAEFGDRLKKVKSINIRDFPAWIYESIVKPVPIVSDASVERYSIDIPGSNIAFIDNHEIHGVVCYSKLFFLFGVHQFLKSNKYSKIIDDLMFRNFGPPDMKTSLIMRPFVGNKCLAYRSDDVVVITDITTQLAQKEFQIHLYNYSFFQLISGNAFKRNRVRKKYVPLREGNGC